MNLEGLRLDLISVEQVLTIVPGRAARAVASVAARAPPTCSGSEEVSGSRLGLFYGPYSPIQTIWTIRGPRPDKRRVTQPVASDPRGANAPGRART